MLSVNVASIVFDGRLTSDLQWKRQVEEAVKYVEGGIPFVWELDLGLFRDLQSLENETYFLTLSLSVDHFIDSVWGEFEKSSNYVILYRGYALNELQAEYLEMLASRFPEDLQVIAIVDVEKIGDPLERLYTLHQEHLPSVRVVTCLEELNRLNAEKGATALLLPLASFGSLKEWEPLRKGIQYLTDHKIPFRAIPEATLINEWHGLDTLIVASETLSRDGIRSLQGFCAAGGTVLTIGGDLPLTNTNPLEIA